LTNIITAIPMSAAGLRSAAALTDAKRPRPTANRFIQYVARIGGADPDPLRYGRLSRAHHSIFRLTTRCGTIASNAVHCIPGGRPADPVHTRDIDCRWSGRQISPVDSRPASLCASGISARPCQVNGY
jgi:hypothetical protein